MVVELTDKDFYTNNPQRLSSKYNDKIVIVKFYSPNCGHCIRTIPEYNKLSDMASKKDVVIAQLDCTQYPKFMSNLNNTLYGYKVHGFPTFILFINSLFIKNVDSERTAHAWYNDIKQYF